MIAISTPEHHEGSLSHASGHRIPDGAHRVSLQLLSQKADFDLLVPIFNYHSPIFWPAPAPESIDLAVHYFNWDSQIQSSFSL